MKQGLAAFAVAVVTCALGLGVPRRVLACGGCFHGPPQPMAQATVVTGHRMAFAVSSERTVLWDQIQYDGAPEDFSWVLPVLPGATIEASTDAWFEALDAFTATRVSAPQLKCASSSPSGGCGCASSERAAALDSGSGYVDRGVTVLHQGTVGPYDTVTLESTSGDTLSAWLGAHGYTVPDDIAPVIADYVTEGFDFIALRLSPNVGVQQMTPVRVVTPGPEGPLPLRMVAAGIGESVGITLYVIGEGRYALPDLVESSLDPKELSWDFATSQSNYLDVREEALSWYFGYRYLTTFADPGAFAKNYVDLDGYSLSPAAGGTTMNGFVVGGTRFTTLADFYFGQAHVNAGQPASGCPPLTTPLAASGLVEQKAPPGALPASAFACDGYDDIAAAMIGMHPSAVWLNRLEMDLPRAALSADCVVSLNDSQTPVSQFVRAAKKVNPPAACTEPVFQSSLVSERGLVAWLGMVGVMLVARLRRRGR